MAEYFSIGRLHEGETQVPTFTLYSGAGAGTVVALTSISTATLTLKDESGNTINSRSAQNVKNVNNVTIHSTSGLVTWAMQAADTTVAGTAATVRMEARFVFTLTDSQVLHVHLQLVVEQGLD